MSNKKLIPCRVCGKLFEPCTYCQTHADIFRWRNFACSIECAQKYINDTIAYRKSLEKQNNLVTETSEKYSDITIENSERKPVTKRKSNKKISTEN